MDAAVGVGVGGAGAGVKASSSSSRTFPSRASGFRSDAVSYNENGTTGIQRMRSDTRGFDGGRCSPLRRASSPAHVIVVILDAGQCRAQL